MSILKQSKRNVRRSELEKDMKNTLNGCNTAKEVLDFLFGTYNDDYQHDYVVKRRFYTTGGKTTIINRLNCLWVYPVFILLIPFRFVLFGSYQINEDSKLGMVLIKLIGELR